MLTCCYYLLVHKIEERHSILGQIYGFWKKEETESYDNAIYWRWALTVTVGALIVLEVATYFVYLFVVCLDDF